MIEEFSALLSASGDEVISAALELYLDLHRNPELSGQEQRTAAQFANAIAAAGLDVTQGVGGHGVVGLLPNGDGPTVLVRCDLDALPVEERTGLAYASQVWARGPDGIDVPVMHACGHDLHAAAVVGAVRLLAELRPRWSGTLVVVGQPAEETLSGARAMLADGLYSRFPRPDVALGQHVAPFQAGVLAHGSQMTAASLSVEAVVYGRGGHAASPKSAVNPIEIASSVVRRISALATSGGNLFNQTVITVGALHAGSVANVIPDEARLSISLRGLSDTQLATAVGTVQRIIRAESESAGATKDPMWTVTSETMSQSNDPHYAAVVRDIHKGVFGAGRIVDWPPSMIAEDFPLYGAAGAEADHSPPVPTVYWIVGSVGPRQWARTPGGSVAEKLAALPGNHSPFYAPEPAPTLRTAVVAMASGALGCFADQGNSRIPAATAAGSR